MSSIFVGQDEFDRRLPFATVLFESRPDDVPRMVEMGMKPYAALRYCDRQVQLDITGTMKHRVPGIYAFAAAGRVVKVGSSMSGVPGRLRDHPRHINRSLGGQHYPTPEWEARLWEHVYVQLASCHGEVWVRESEPIVTGIGLAPARIACKVEEYLVAEAFSAPGLGRPLLNVSTRIN